MFGNLKLTLKLGSQLDWSYGPCGHSWSSDYLCLIHLVLDDSGVHTMFGNFEVNSEVFETWKLICLFEVMAHMKLSKFHHNSEFETLGF